MGYDNYIRIGVSTEEEYQFVLANIELIRKKVKKARMPVGKHCYGPCACYEFITNSIDIFCEKVSNIDIHFNVILIYDYNDVEYYKIYNGSCVRNNSFEGDHSCTFDNINFSVMASPLNTLDIKYEITGLIRQSWICERNYMNEYGTTWYIRVSVVKKRDHRKQITFSTGVKNYVHFWREEHEKLLSAYNTLYESGEFIPIGTLIKTPYGDFNHSRILPRFTILFPNYTFIFYLIYNCASSIKIITMSRDIILSVTEHQLPLQQLSDTISFRYLMRNKYCHALIPCEITDFINPGSTEVPDTGDFGNFDGDELTGEQHNLLCDCVDEFNASLGY